MTNNMLATGAKIFTWGALGAAAAGTATVGYIATRNSLDCENLYTLIGITPYLPLILTTGFVAGASLKIFQEVLTSGKIGTTMNWIAKP